ncbi:MAG: class I SAM-dependent methyltransferase [Rickettsiales bacterium]|jgi:predicted O-methyltransferase YrrM|nr:class I SAM-dependent methyltransferase [Rickettsiales bacterium]
MKNKYLLSTLAGIIIALTICVVTAVIFRKNHISKNHIMNDVYIDKNFTHDWFTKNIKIWDTYKNLFYSLKNKRCLEVGAFEGKATLYLAENYCNGEGSVVDTIDTWEGSLEHTPNDKRNLYDRFISNLKSYIENNRVTAYRGPSSETLMRFIEEVRDGKREKYDFIYIDASHLAKDVLMDAVLSWELLKTEGMMFFDDYEWHPYPKKPWLEPKVAINGFLDAYSTMYELLYKDYQIHIKKTSDTPRVVGP